MEEPKIINQTKHHKEMLQEKIEELRRTKPI